MYHFDSNLQEILEDLKYITTRSKLKRFFDAEADRRTIAGCNRKMDQVLQKFDVS